MSLLTSARDRFEAGGLKPEKDKGDKDKKEKSSKSEGDSSADKAVKEALRSGEWKEVKDASGKTYYYNTKTKKTTWDLKKELKKLADEQAAASPSPKESVASPPPQNVAPAQPEPTAPVATPQPEVAMPAPQQPVPVAPPVQPPPTQPSVQPAATNNVAASPAPARPTQGPSFGGDVLPNVVPYVDPVDRLLKHNEDLRKVIAGGSRGQVAIDFQQRYDALERTNAALSVQLERLKVEHQSMAVALMDANKKIHEQQAALARYQPTPERSKEEELFITLSHLREQNRVLVTQCAELSTLLARGLNETAARAADHRAASGDYVGSAANSSESGARLISRFLDSGARHALCPNCVLSVTRYRDKLLGPTDTNVGRTPLSSAGSPGRYDPYAAVGGNAVPAYKPVPDITSPPPSHYYSEPAPPGHAAANAGYHGQESPFTYGIPPAAGNASIRSGAPTESPPVMFGGFVVRNARVPA